MEGRWIKWKIPVLPDDEVVQRFGLGNGGCDVCEIYGTPHDGSYAENST